MTGAPEDRTPGPAAMFTSKTPEWYTPPEIIEAVRDLFGGMIDLDPCSNAEGDRPHVPAAEHYTREDDGLAHAWYGRVYMNPPYGRGIKPWIEKVREEYEAGRISEAVVLVKSATDTAWFRILSGRFPRCEVAGRLKFSGCDSPAPFPSVLFYLGDEVQQFAEAFGGFGVIVAPLPATPEAAEAVVT
ncbi:MAG: adenine methyltransferase [Methanomicrobiales archaeon]|nr:adenine methyltransferase [Methanomicrobiales archaeon]